jgi:hypothetical protein
MYSGKIAVPPGGGGIQGINKVVNNSGISKRDVLSYQHMILN